MSDMSQWALVPSDPAHPDHAQTWTNKATGETVFGHTLGMMPGIVIQVDPKTGDRIPNANLNVHDGTPHKDDSLASFLLKGAGLIAGGIGAGALLGGGGAAAAGAGGASAGGGAAASGAGAAAAGAGAGGAAGTGGFLSTLGTVGKVASGIASGAAAGRVQQNTANQTADQIALQRARLAQDIQTQNAQLDLQRRQFALTAPQTQAHQAVAGDALSHAQDFNLSVPGVAVSTATGGLRPSMIGDTGRKAAETLADNATASLVKGNATKFDPIASPTVPGATPQPAGNALTTLLGIIGGGASLAGALKPKPLVPDAPSRATQVVPE